MRTHFRIEIEIFSQIKTAVNEELISIFTAFYHARYHIRGQALTTYLEYFQSKSSNKRFRCHYANFSY